MAIRVTLSTDGTEIRTKPETYLGSDLFARYRQACVETGARYHHETRENILPVDSLTLLLNALKQQGLACALDQTLADILAQQAEEAEQLLHRGRGRVEAAQAHLERHGLALFRFQQTGVEWLAPRRGAVLADDMGLGKTVQALIALPDAARALCVVPASLRLNWQKEARRWRPDLTPVVAATKAQFRWPDEGEIVIVSYGCLPPAPAEKDENGLPIPEEDRVWEVSPPPLGMHLVADEAHALKNHRTKRAKAFGVLRDATFAHRGVVWAITGTPVLNRPPELWSLLKATGTAEESFGTWYSFVRLFGGQKTSLFGGFDWGQPSPEVVDRIRRVCLHRRREEVLRDLPTKLRTTTTVEGGSAPAADAIVDALEAKGFKLEELSLDRVVKETPFELISAARAQLAEVRIPALLDRVLEYEDAREPLVVFSCHLKPLEVLQGRPGWALITGGTPADERERIVERFQAGELIGLAGTIKAMGVGLTLTKAHHALFVDLDWTPALNTQAEDRICRIGQEAQQVFVERLVTQHPLDERVLELLTEKQRIIDSSITASAVSEDHVGESPAERLVQAAKEARETASVLATQAELDRQREERQRREALDAVKRRLGSDWDGRELRVSKTGKARSPANAREEWAGRGLIQLAELDPDRAGVLNGVGFSKHDGEIGHSLAAWFNRTGMMSDAQWRVAIKLARRYRRQIGSEPEAE